MRSQNLEDFGLPLLAKARRHVKVPQRPLREVRDRSYPAATKGEIGAHRKSAAVRQSFQVSWVFVGLCARLAPALDLPGNLTDGFRPAAELMAGLSQRMSRLAVSANGEIAIAWLLQNVRRFLGAGVGLGQRLG